MHISSVELTQHAQGGTCLSVLINGSKCCLDNPEIEKSLNNNDCNLTVPLVWFRDHCRSPKTYYHASDQRKSNVLNLLEESRIVDRSAVTFDGDKLSIEWKDGHKSVFDSDLLIKLLIKPFQMLPQALYNIWSGSTIGSLPTLDRSSFSFAEFSDHFVHFGFVIVDGIEPTVEATEKFAREIAPFHDTFYGPIWTLNSDADEPDEYHAETAYSNEELGPHNDGAFSLQSPGVQVFHCLRPADVGGDTGLVDGFAAAERLKREKPDAYRVLTTTPIDHQYIVRGYNPLHSWAPGRPVIELNADGGYVQIRFNPYHRAPLRLSLNGESGLSRPADVTAFYEAYQAFSRICHDPAMAVVIHLTPGTVIFIDNHRLLHSRIAFTGHRQMVGCYLSRDNLMAKARLHLEEDIRLQV